jgi:hypothetical protein
MSGTASRFQTRLGYAPGLRVGQYPGAAAPVPMAPPAAGVAPVGAAPVTPSAPMAPGGSIAPGAAAPVMAGSVRTDRQPGGYDGGGAGGSAQGDYGGPGPSGIGSTGSVVGDLAGFGREAGLAAGGLMGGPMGVMGTTFGAMASGLAAALGAPQTAAEIARSVGLPGVAPTAYTGAVAEGPGATVGSPVGIGAFGTPDLGEAPAAGYGTPGVSVKGDEFGVDNMSATMGPAESPDKTGASYGEGDKGGDSGGAPGTAGAGDNANSNSEAGASDAAGPGDAGGMGDSGDYMRGGYTGAGPDGVVQPNRIAGRVHEGEAVIPAAAVARYGLTPLMLLARGQVEPSRLSAMLRG